MLNSTTVSTGGRQITRLSAKLRQQESIPGSIAYLVRYVTRRGPSAVQRWWRTRSELSKFQHRERSREVANLGVLVNGGVGDHIIAARFMRDLRSSCEPFVFDVFSANPGFGSWIFASVPGFQHCSYDTLFHALSRRFDVNLELSAVATIRSAGLLSSLRLRQRVDNINAFGDEMKGFLSGPSRMDGFLAQKLVFQNVTRATSLHSIAGVTYGGDEFLLNVDKRYLVKFNLEGKRYVTVHNGFEAKCATPGGQATKCYPHFGEVISLLRQQMPDLLFVQIGTKTSVPLRQADVDLVGKTSLPEASAIIQGAAAHLDNESGLVHIASCLSIPCCVVFGPTPSDYFAYANHVSVRPKACGGCWWITEDWMERCPRGFAQPICTYSQSPSEVAQAMSQLLGGKSSLRRETVKLLCASQG